MTSLATGAQQQTYSRRCPFPEGTTFGDVAGSPLMSQGRITGMCQAIAIDLVANR
ncbi:hypothetical protein [Bartonella sp. HY038]|uniref:hypothetical protein n=1 Tax=Bartonella sp. HY038 TaxID=2759660 RepID=UPI0015F878D5|nr:hypothetical protein [Bartonella sp. HY038]